MWPTWLFNIKSDHIEARLGLGLHLLIYMFACCVCSVTVGVHGGRPTCPQSSVVLNLFNTVVSFS